jgi:hypothetical protein
MIGHKLPNKTKSATVAEPKLFHQLNNPSFSETSEKATIVQRLYWRAGTSGSCQPLVHEDI